MMKTAELSGVQLDYWVAKAEGRDAIIECGMCQVVTYEDSMAKCYSERRYHDSWANGGQIIEREKIWLSDDEDGKWIASCPPHVDVDNGRDLIQFGATPIEAAMRAYVASKFGDEVPDEQAA